LRPERLEERIRLFCCGRNDEPGRLNPEPENEREPNEGEENPRDGALARYEPPEKPPRELLELWWDEPPLRWELPPCEWP
jgi:hypothetical protein